MTGRMWGFVGLVALLACGSLHAATIYVPDDHATIQAAIDAASDGDTVIVRDGVYTGAGNRDLTFSDGGGGWKTIAVISENGPANCTIDAQGSSGDPHRCFKTVLFAGAIIDGFTITGGYAVGDGGNYDNEIAGGGGGMYIGTNGGTSFGTVSNCVVTENYCDGFGGGVALQDWPNGTNTTFANNVVCYNVSNGGSFGGGGLWLGWHNGLVEDNEIYGNRSLRYGGGGVGTMDPSNMVFRNNVVAGNYANFWLGGGFISEADFAHAWAYVYNNTIAHNRSSSQGTGIANYYSQIFYRNNIVWENQQTSTGNITEQLYSWAYYAGYAECRYGKSDVTGQSGIGPGNWLSYGGDYGGNPDEGDNFETNPATPHFVAPGVWTDPNTTPGDLTDDFFLVGDYHLAPGSPAIDTGRDDLGVAADIDGDARPQGAHVDVGADEFTAGTPPVADAQCAAYGYESETSPYNMQLDGTGSTNCTTYAWTQLSGEAVTINNAGSALADFDAPMWDGSTELLIADCTLEFQLSVDGGADTDTCSTYIRLPGDATGDNIINAFDIAKVRVVDPSADFNGDMVVNAFDLAILRRNAARRRTL